MLAAAHSKHTDAMSVPFNLCHALSCRCTPKVDAARSTHPHKLPSVAAIVPGLAGK